MQRYGDVQPANGGMQILNMHQKGLNIRDMASINELVVLSNLESFNSELIKLSIPKQKRFKQLQEMAQKQIQQLNTWETERKFRQIDNNTNLIE